MKKILDRISIKYKIIGLTIGIVTLVVVTTLILVLEKEYTIMSDNLKEQSNTLLDIITKDINIALHEQDILRSNQLLSPIKEFSIVDNASIFYFDNIVKNYKELAFFNKDSSTNSHRFPFSKIGNIYVNNNYIEQDDGIYFYRAINDGGRHIGIVWLKTSKVQLKQKTRELIRLMAIIFLSMISLSFFIALVIQRRITKPIFSLAEIAERISKEGDYSVRVDIETAGEIGMLCNSFNKMLTQISEQNQKIQDLNQSLDYKIQQRVTELTLAKEESDRKTNEAVEAKQQLEQIAVELEKKHKFDAALAKFAEIMQAKSTENIEKWGDHLLYNIIQHINALQGALYTAEDVSATEIRLRLISTYAYDIKTILKKVMKSGDGLPGESVKLKKVMLFDNLPPGYLKAVSALGEADIKNLLIIPLIAEDQVQGVIELASFNKFSEEDVNFLTNISKNIAYALLVVKNKDNIQRLLNDTRQKNEMLELREEELKNKIAELELTQQEMTKVEQNLRHSEENLRILNENLEKIVEDRTSELQSALENLKSTQAQLVQSEKMASLGQLIAGIAHEINTPIGAVKASASNMEDILPMVVTTFPDFISNLNSEQKMIFINLATRALNESEFLTSKEARAKRKEIQSLLDSYNIENSDSIARKLIDIGITKVNLEDLILISEPIGEQALEFVYKFTQLKLNLSNINVATEKTKKIVFALKSHAYKHTDDQQVAINIEESIDIILVLYNNQIKHDINLVLNFFEQPLIVMGFPDELGQVWTNIIHNALQAMNYKGTLTINLYPADQNAIIEIIDTGKGIPPEIINKIFDPFFTTKSKGEGTGLGLDICRKIIQKHNGSIQVESEPGNTCFRISLPLYSIGTPTNQIELNAIA